MSDLNGGDTFSLEVLNSVLEKLKSSPTIAAVPCRRCGKGQYLLRFGGGYMTSLDSDFRPPLCDECRGIKWPPDPDPRAVVGCTFVARIRRTSDGLEREKEFSFYDNGDYGAILWFSEGNYSCDCNRDASFVLEDEDEDSTCGETRYLVQLRYHDGEIFYDEFADGRRE